MKNRKMRFSIFEIGQRSSGKKSILFFFACSTLAILMSSFLSCDPALAGGQRISAGASHTVALKPDGTLWYWGYDGGTTSGNLPIQIGSDKKWTAVSAGDDYTLATKADGTLWAWGSNMFGQLGDSSTTDRNDPIQIGSENNWVNVIAGFRHSLGLRTDGTLWAWGNNAFGQLGDGTYIEQHVPVRIGNDNNWIAISSGGNYSVALKSNGTLWGWGSRNYTGNNSNVPTQIGSDNNWAAVAEGGFFSAALKTDGTLWTWGENDRGSLGDGSTLIRDAPVQIGNDKNWVAVSAGYEHTLAVKSDGTLWAWGWNIDGQLGDGTTADRYTPIQVGTDNNWVAVSAGDEHTLAVKSDGTLWAWGWNGDGELGDGTTTDRHSPVNVGTEYQPISVAAGAYHNLVLKDDGVVAAWGMDDSGQTDVPTGLSNVRAIAAGMSYSVALKSDGTVVAWGNNGNGQTNVPAGLNNVTAISAGVGHTVALKSDGTVVAWGNDSDGQTNVPAGLSNVKAVAAGMSHSVALKGDGTVVAWGDDSFGETDAPVGIANVTALVAGQNSTLALKSDGTLTAWGRNLESQTTIPLGLKNVRAIGSGYYHSLAVTSDGTLSAWGDNNDGQTSVPLGLNDVIAVAAGAFHTVALKSDGTLSAWGDNSFGQSIAPAVNVTIVPPKSIDAGAQWSINNGATWHDSGVTLIEAPGNYTVTFKSLQGWQTPSAQTVAVGTSMVAVNATYIIIPYELTAGTDGNGNGTLTSLTPGVNCVANSCDGTLDYGTTALITANAAAGSAFSKWSGCDTVSGNQCTVLVKAVTKVTATFDLCDYSFAPASMAFGPTGGIGIMTIASNNPSCIWNTGSNYEWLSVTPNSGSGKGAITISAAANSDVMERIGTLTIAEKTFSVTQSGENCTYSISSTQLNFDANSGSGSINIAAPAGCYWTVANNAIPWIKILSGSVGNGNGTATFNVDANSGGAQRTGTVTIEGQTVTVTQSQWIPGGSEWLNLGFDNAYGVSADGSVVVGDKSGHAVRWTKSGGVVDIGTLGGSSSIALGVSADGGVIVGEADDFTGHSRAFRWTQADGMTDIGTLGGSYAQAYGVSADDSVVVGWATDSAGNTHAFRWTQSNGMSDIGTGIIAQAASADGTVVVGGGVYIDGSHPFSWTQDTGTVSISSWPSSSFTGISADGNTVIGYGQYNQQWRSFHWTQDTGAIDLGVIVGSPASWYPSEAYGVSADGNVVVGYASYYNASGNWRGYRWSPATGMQTINQWLADNGLNASAVESYIVRGVSADGNTVVGSGSGGAFRARVVSGQYLLTAYTSGMRNATLSSTTPEVTCIGSTCSGAWSDSGASVVIIATADAGYAVSNWTGCDSVVDNQCTVVMNTSKVLSVTITPIQYSLTVNATGNASGSVDASASAGFISFSYPTTNMVSLPVNSGTAVSLQAYCYTDFCSVSWSGDCDSTGGTTYPATCAINNMNAAKAITAIFKVNQYPLTVNANGTGSGTVTSDLPGEISFNYPTANSESVNLDYETALSLTATAPAQSTVIWTGCDSTGGSASIAICTVNSLRAAKTVTATFTANQYSLLVNAIGSGSGNIVSNVGGISFNYPTVNSGNALLNYGMPITLTATSNNAIAGWTGACSATGGTPMSATCTINSLSGNATLTATFSACNFILGTSYATVAPAGGSKSVNLATSNTGCNWSAISNDPWITIASGSSGNGNGTVQYSVASNTGGVRTGTITIAGQTFTVMQGTTLTPAQIGVFRAGAWYVDRGETFGWSGCGPDGCYVFGMAGDQAITGDWDGTGIVRLGVFRNGNWYLDYNGDGQWSGCGTTTDTDRCYTFGMAGDIPVVGDWNGNGVSKIGVFRNGNWYLDYNGDGQWSSCGTTTDTDRCYTFGMAGDIPVVGDWNGNGVSKIGVFRNGNWYLDYNGDGQWSGCGTTTDTDRCYTFGAAGDIPVVGDWNGNGVPKIGVFRGGTWYLDYTGTNTWVGCGAPADASKDVCTFFGMSDDIPVVLK